MRRIIPFLLIGLAIPACRPAPAPPAVKRAPPDRTFDDLLGLMRTRLEVMHDVARWKWAAKSPIDDPEREAALLRDVSDQGSLLGLDPATTRAFFAAQIEAAKNVQRADFSRWEADQRGPEGEAPDLARVLRPRIDSLNRGLIAALARTRPRLLTDRDATARLRSRADQVLLGEGIDDAVRATAIRSLIIADE
jgi:chorismate mutase